MNLFIGIFLAFLSSGLSFKTPHFKKFAPVRKFLQLSDYDGVLEKLIQQTTDSSYTSASNLLEYSKSYLSKLDSIKSFNFEVLFNEIPNHALDLLTNPTVLAINPYYVGLPLAFMTILGFLASTNDNFIESPYLAGTATYNVNIAENFYNERPLFVFKRLLRLAKITSIFNIKLFLDWRFKKLDENQKQRAKEALVLATQLGPTFIKLGQALSIRTDLIPEAYALELRQLQDAVPPFDSKEAKEIIRKELNVPDLSLVFKTITDQPIASASIGQVYKATLLNGQEVAIKVQRPNVLAEIALDLYLLRLLTPFQVKISNTINKRSTEAADIDVALNLVDEWGRGFVAEVDYRLEAKNTKDFREAMSRLQLNAVTAPAVMEQLCSSKVIVTEWMDGTRLDRDASPDVPRLCGVAVNAYLTMLLDTGVLHCDPHPGNLLRTRDGKLCILDWGMTLAVPPDLQYGLLEFIAHVNTEDFEALPNDFINIGFSPPDKLELLKSSGLTEGLSFALRQLNKGGGPSKIRERVAEEFRQRYGSNLSDEEIRERARAEMISQFEDQLKKEGVNVNGVTEVMEAMSRRNRELFKLPSYVLYVSRAFSTLEGIGLSIDENYSILQESYPYLAKRLFTDNSPRAKAALRSMLFESSGSGGMLSSKKLIEMSDGYSSYTAATTDADRDNLGLQKAQEALSSILLSTEGNSLQDLVLEGAAKMTDSVVREGIYRVKESQAGVLLKSVLKTQYDLVHRIIPGQLQVFALPITLPYHFAKVISDLSEKDISDEVAITSVTDFITIARSKLTETNSNRLATGQEGNSGQLTVFGEQRLGDRADLIIGAREQIRKTISNPEAIRQQLPVLTTISRRFASAVLKRAAERIEAKMSHLETITPANKNSISQNKNVRPESIMQWIEENSMDKKDVIETEALNEVFDDMVANGLKGVVGNLMATSARSIATLVEPVPAPSTPSD